MTRATSNPVRPLRRRSALLAATALALLGTAGAAQAADWPSKPIQILIPYSPGGSVDLLARPLAARLQERLGQPVVLDYKPGAGGILASQTMLRTKPDGHTFVMVIAAHAINPSMQPKLPYDTQKDFAPVSLVATMPQPDGSLAFMTIDPVALGVSFVRADKDGVRKLIVRDGQHEYVFDEVK